MNIDSIALELIEDWENDTHVNEYPKCQARAGLQVRIIEAIKDALAAQKEKDAGIADNYEDNLRDCENQNFYDELTDRIAEAIRKGE